MRVGKLFAWTFWAGVAVLSLYLIYAAISEQIALRKYGAYFAQARHPSGTRLLDSLSFGFSYYPATYIDENIDFVPVYLVGELREYAGGWDEVKSFYQQHPRLDDGTYIGVLPLVVDQSEQSTWLAVMDGVSYDPSDAAVIEELKDQYGWHGIPKSLTDTSQKIYLVYSLWWPSDR